MNRLYLLQTIKVTLMTNLEVNTKNKRTCPEKKKKFNFKTFVQQK